LRHAAFFPHSVVLAATCFATLTATAATPSKPALITQRLDETRLVRLTGSTRPAALDPRNDLGEVGSELRLDHVQILLQRPSPQQAALKNFEESLNDPNSVDYHHWLSAAEFGDRFGISTADVEQLVSWLENHGFTVDAVPASRGYLDFSGTASQVSEAFHTEIHYLQVNGEKHISNTSDPSVPEAFAPAIRGIASLNDFGPHPMSKRIAKARIDPDTGPAVTTSDGSFGVQVEYTSSQGPQLVTPGDLQTIYNMNPVYAAGYSGQGQTIVVLEDTDLYTTKDWNTFRSVFGLTKYSEGKLVTVHPGNCTDPDVNGWDSEAILDAEYASAAAPSATIEVASCASTRTTFGGLLALEKLVDSKTPPPAVISMSYGECESFNGSVANALFAETYAQAVAEGVSVFVSAGDEGAASCDADEDYAYHGLGVSGYASTPYNVAVGGTDFGDTFAGTNANYWSNRNSPTYESAKSYIDEIPWNNSCASSLLASYMTDASLTAVAGDNFCNSAFGESYATVTAASGGASGCASGTPSIEGYVDGTCKGTPKPSWQTGVAGIPADKVRDIPDVSLFASNGVWGHYYVVCFSDVKNGGAPCTGKPENWTGFGGTSVSAPIMAGIQTLVNQKDGGRQGNPNPIYYKLAAKEYGTKGSSICNSTLGNKAGKECVFYDITQGDTDIDCQGKQDCYAQPGATYGVLSTADFSLQAANRTGIGYDLATGIGSVNAYNLVYNWKTVTAKVAEK